MARRKRTLKKWIQNKSDEIALANGCWFDDAAGKHAVEFFERHLRHSKGQWAGQRFTLQKWQRDKLIMPLFGWKRKDGTRRFRVAYIEVPKKNGKSTLSSGIALYLLVADGEPAAEVFCAAADRNQAGIVFGEAENMVKSSKPLAARLRMVPSQKRIVFEQARAFLRVLSSDSYTAEGLNIHGLIFDELHAQKGRTLWDALRYGGASRRQPMLVSITTAGHSKNTICYEQHDYAKKVLDGVVEDDAFFARIWAANPERDDWTKPRTWKRANPSMGVTMNEEDFAQACQEAQSSPAKENAFKRYRLNIWTEQAVRWLQMARWEKCAGDVSGESLTTSPAWGGLDIASTTDIAAFVLAIPVDGTVYLVPRFWVPEENAGERERRDRVPYLTWANQGHICLTEGNQVDYDRVRADINEMCETYAVQDIAYDPWNATQLAQQLDVEDGIPMVQFRQGMASYNEPSKEFERLVKCGRLAHGNNPVLTWMASHVAVRQDANENIMPCKKSSTERIDGIAAAIMALGRSMVGDALEDWDGELTIV